MGPNGTELPNPFMIIPFNLRLQPREILGEIQGILEDEPIEFFAVEWVLHDRKETYEMNDLNEATFVTQ